MTPVMPFIIVGKPSNRYAAKVGTWQGGMHWGFTTDPKQAERFQTMADAIDAREAIILVTGAADLTIEPESWLP